MTAPRPESERTCVGCRRRAPASSLARLALRDGRLVVWAKGATGTVAPRPSGRGASLHADSATCLRAAFSSGALARAFRGQLSSGNPDEADLVQQLTAASAASSRVNKKT